MKILMVTHYFGSHKGGIELVAEALFRELSAQGQKVVWMAGDCTPPPENPEGSRAQGFRVVNFVEALAGVPFPIPTLAALWAIRKAVKQTEIVFLHDCLYLTNIAAFLMALLYGVPVVLIQHTVPNETGVVKTVMKLATALFTRRMLSRAHQVIFISETTKEFYRDISFRSEPAVIFNGVDCNIFQPSLSDGTKERLRAHFGLPPGHPVVLFVGRFVEKKGLEVLKRMVEINPGYAWAFAGWGPLDPSGWQAACVRVFSGLHGESLADLYRASDLLVLPSAKEGFPLVVQEALACGLRVVCGAETATADADLKRFTVGVPVYVGDTHRTAREFLSAIDGELSSAQPSEAQTQAHDFAASRYSWRRAAERYIEIASRLLQESDGRRVEVETPAQKCAK